MKKDDFEYVRHILESISYIGLYTKRLTKGSFSKHEEKTDAVVRRLTIIGEQQKTYLSILKQYTRK
jgi:uncharacterized protein with HEPN domain